MTRLLCTLSLLLLCLSTPAQADERMQRIADVHAEMGQVMSELRAELASLDDLIEAADSRGVQREIHRKVERIEQLTRVSDDLTERLARIARHVGRDRPVETVVIVESPPQVVVIDEGPLACSSTDFAQVLGAVKRASFADEKVVVIRDAAQHRWFTVGQVTRLMGALSFGDNKVDAAALLHARVVDNENWYLVYDALTFDSEKNALRDRVGRH